MLEERKLSKNPVEKAIQCYSADFYEMTDKEVQTQEVEIHALSSVGSDDETMDR